MAEIECTIYQKVYRKSKAGRYDYTRARCSKCGNTTESNGSGNESIKRCLALMRASCPNKENNFYIISQKPILEKQPTAFNFLNNTSSNNCISNPHKVLNDETLKNLIDENKILQIDVTYDLGKKIVDKYKEKDRITWSSPSKSGKGYTYFTVSYSFRIYENKCYIDGQGSYGNYKHNKEARKRIEQTEPEAFTKKSLSNLLLFLWQYDKYSILNIWLYL